MKISHTENLAAKKFSVKRKELQGPKISRKGIRPSGRVPSKKYSSCFDFHSSIFRSIQTEKFSKLRFLPSEFGRLLELMPIFLSGLSYDFNWNFNFWTDLPTSRNTVGPLVMSSKFYGGSINKHQNTGPTDWQNLTVHSTWNYIP